MIKIITPLINIFIDRRNCPTTLILASKCLYQLCSKASDKVFRKKIVFEGNIMEFITRHLEEFYFDEKLVLCCLELLGVLMNEPEIPLPEILYGKKLQLFNRLKSFLEPTGVPGTFQSQRVRDKI
jgi:hypothetical protein